MAKALLGHVSVADPRATARLAAENRLLRQRVADLEAHVVRLQAENDQLAAVGAGSVERALDGQALLPV